LQRAADLRLIIHDQNSMHFARQSRQQPLPGRPATLR
jgi:hypothetical protein